MSDHFWGTTSFAQQQARQAQWIFYGVLLLLVGPLALGVAWWLSRRWRGWLWYSVTGPISLLWSNFWFEWVWQAHAPAAAVLWWWGGLVVASPGIVLLLHFWRVVFAWLRPRDLQEQLAEQQQYLARQNAALSRQARRDEKRMPPFAPGWLTLGPRIKGEQFPPSLGIRHVTPWLQIDDRLLSQHVLIVGTTGAGKSETIKRLIAETLAGTQRDVFFVDGKGDQQLGQEIAQQIFQARQQPVPVFTLGWEQSGSVYHGFCGTAPDIYNRLCTLVGVDEASDNAQFFADINRDLLQLICYAPEGPPRSFEEVRERLNLGWLHQAYKDNVQEQQTLAELSPQLLQGLLVRIRPLVREFAPLVGPEGFALEETKGAVFSLRTQSVGDTARRFLNFLVEDLKDFAGKRQRRPGLLIIDEFGAFRNESIVALLTLARSADLGVVLATQDIASLGLPQATRLILANTRTKLLMATDFPEEVAKLAGTIYQIEASIQHQLGDATGMGSARVQHTFRVDMTESARLEAGEAFLIRQRHAAKLRIRQVGSVVPTKQAVLRLKKRRAVQQVVQRSRRAVALPKLRLRKPIATSQSAPAVPIYELERLDVDG